jgi:hypothetical protein
MAQENAKTTIQIDGILAQFLDDNRRWKETPQGKKAETNNDVLRRVLKLK